MQAQSSLQELSVVEAFFVEIPPRIRPSSDASLMKAGRNRTAPTPNNAPATSGTAFSLTAKRWWATLKDDSEDQLPQSIHAVSIAKKQRALDRWRKVHARRREQRHTRGRSKVVAARPRSRRVVLSKHVAICVRYWLVQRWRNQRRRLIQIKRDRSWAILLQNSRSWKRYLFLRPWFTHWRLAHTREYCVRRNELLLTRRGVALGYTRRRLREGMRFWRLLSRIARSCKRLVFRQLRLYAKLPRLVRHLGRAVQAEGFHRWRRRSRWPRVAALFAQRLRAAVAQWRHSSAVMMALRSSVLRARRLLNKRILAHWRHHAHVFLFCSSSQQLAVHHYQLSCKKRGLSATRVFFRQGSQLKKARLAASYCRLRKYFFAWGTLTRAVAVMLAQHSANIRSEAHFAQQRRQEILSVWRDRTARLQRHAASYERGRRCVISAAFHRFVVHHHCGRASRHAVAASNNGRFRHRLVHTIAVWAKWAAEERQRTAQMRLAREHAQARRVPAGLRKWRRISRQAQMLNHVVAFFRLNIRVAAALGVWGRRKEHTIAQMISIRRGCMRWQLQHSRRALSRLFAWTLRRRVHRRMHSVFRRLHPVPRCSAAAKVFAAWAREYTPLQLRQRGLFKTVRRRCRLRTISFFFEQWDEAFFKTSRGKGSIWRALAGRRALRRWEDQKIKSHAAWALLARYISHRGLRCRNSGGHLAGYAVRTPACIFFVQLALRAPSFPKFCTACFLRRLFRLWGRLTTNAARAAILHNSAVYFGVHRAAALARATPASRQARSVWLVRQCWLQLVTEHSRRALQKRRVLLVCCRVRKKVTAWRQLHQASIVAKYLGMPDPPAPRPRPPPKLRNTPNTTPRLPPRDQYLSFF